jgi:hypothetical protein
MWLLLVLRQPAQVKLHLPGMLRAEFLQLEVHGHKPPQFAMIEQQVDIKVFFVHPDPPLPRNEGETIVEFEQEGFDLSQDRGFQLSLAVAVVKPEEIEDVKVAEDQIGSEAVFRANLSTVAVRPRGSRLIVATASATIFGSENRSANCTSG